MGSAQGIAGRVCSPRGTLFLATRRGGAQWFKQGKNLREARKQRLVLDRPALEKMLRRGKDRTFEDLGFRIGAWNGAEDEYDSTSFYIKCGGHATEVANLCLFHLPNRQSETTMGPNAERVNTAGVLSGLVRCMAEAWEPEWAVAPSSAHRDLVAPKPETGTFVGWVMYHANSRGPVPPLPEPVRVEPVEDKGTLIVLTPERFTVTNPEHVALARRVHLLLEPAGLLRPLRR